MSKKIAVTKKQYEERKKYLHEKYNNEYINKIINKKLNKLEIENSEKNSEVLPLIESIKIDTTENRAKLESRAGVSVEKTNKSIGTKNWSIFRSKEYAKYKQQMSKEEASYQHFAKLAGYVWSNLNDVEKFDVIENGWGGNWSKVVIK